MTIEIPLSRGWHATIFLEGWMVLLIAGLAVTVLATLVRKFFLRVGQHTN
jgi:hypothetical protein